MKKIIYLIFVLFSAVMPGQVTTPTYGNAGQLTDFLGGAKFRKQMGMPTVNTDLFVPYVGCIRYNPSTFNIEAYNGTSWEPYTKFSDLNGYASNTDLEQIVESMQQFAINGVKDIPEFIEVFGSTNSSILTYKTDTYRTIDLAPYVPSLSIFNVNEIERNGNDLFIVGNFAISGHQSFFITLKDCKIINNVLTVGTATGTYLPIDRPHGIAFNRGYVYVSDRPLINTSTNSRLLKINPNDLSDIKVKTFDDITGGFIGRTTSVLPYKNKLYILMGNENINIQTYFLEIDENMNDAKVLFTYGSESTFRVNITTDFLIYNDEIFIPTVEQGNFNKLGLSVFSITGTLKRRVNGFNISSNTNAYALVHWIYMINNKLVMSVTNTHNKLVRFNPGYNTDDNSISLEEVINLPTYPTDDQSVDTAGNIYIIGEPSTSVGLIPQLLKIKYNDFNNITTLISNVNGGAGSYGMINPHVYKETISVSFGYVDSKVVQTITDGVTTSAPSQDAVFDGLALKMDKTGGTFTGNILTQNVTPSNNNIYTSGSTNMRWSNITSSTLTTNILTSYATGANLTFRTSAGAGRFVMYNDTGNIRLGGGADNATDMLQVVGTASVSSAPSPGTTQVVRDVDLQFTKPSYTSITSAYTTGTARTITANGTFTVTLATTGIPDGMEYYVENTGTGTITCVVSGGGTIEGVASKINNIQWSGITFVKTGSNYIIKN